MFDANGDWGIDTLVTIIKIDPVRINPGIFDGLKL